MAWKKLSSKKEQHDVFNCLSTDSKPTAGIAGLSFCYETDTTTLYVFDGAAWVLASIYGIAP